MKKPYFRARCLVMLKPITLPLELFGVGDTKAQAVRQLKKRCKGAHWAQLDKIEIRQSK